MMYTCTKATALLFCSVLMLFKISTLLSADICLVSHTATRKKEVKVGLSSLKERGSVLWGWIMKISLWLFFELSQPSDRELKWIGKTPQRTVPKGDQHPYRENQPGFQIHLFQLLFFFSPNMCSSYCHSWNQLMEAEPSRVSQLR